MMIKYIDGQPVYEYYRDALKAAKEAGRFEHEVSYPGADMVSSEGYDRVTKSMGADALGDVADIETRQHFVMIHADRTWTSYGDTFYFDDMDDAVAVRLMLY